jgi:uncharacterized protein YjbI with pentapeptide repeats
MTKPFYLKKDNLKKANLKKANLKKANLKKAALVESMLHATHHKKDVSSRKLQNIFADLGIFKSHFVTFKKKALQIRDVQQYF